MCTGEWHKVHLPVYRSCLVEFFQSTHGSECFPWELSSRGKLSQKIRKSAYWLERIFDRAAGGIKATHIDALLLSLASANIIEVQRVQGEDRWNIKRSKADGGTPNYRKDEYWRGVNLHDEKRGRKRDAELLLKKNKPVEDEDGTESVSDSDSEVDANGEVNI